MIANESRLFINEIAASDGINHSDRLRILREFGLKAPDTAFISSHCMFSQDDLSNVTLGEYAFLGHRCYIDNGSEITIGDQTRIATGTMLLTITHKIGTRDRRAAPGCVRKPITIGQGCWIGAGCIIHPGVAIGDGVLIGMGAIVVRNCVDNGQYFGVPARLFRTLP